MRSIILLLSLALCISAAVVSSTCSKGELVSISGSDYCSCYSGWSGTNCDVQASPFNPPAVDPASLSFGITTLFTPTPPTPSAKRASTDPIITVTIPASESAANHPGGPSYSTTTLIKFNGGTNDCDYPNSAWTLSSTSTTDTYVKQLSWAQLHTCGLAKTNIIGGFTYFNTSLNVVRNFFVGNGRFGFRREANVQRKIAVAFPNDVSATKSSVIVSNNTVDAFGSISKVTWINTDQSWKIVLTTVVAFPYKLALSTTPFDDKPFTSKTAHPDRQIIYSTSQPDLGCTTNAQQDCTQSFHFETTLCDLVSFSGWDLTFNPQCRSGSTPDTATECASPATDPIHFVLTLATTTACATDATYIIKTPLLQSYKEGTTAGTVGAQSNLFGTSEKIFFQVSFDSPPAKINSIAVGALCAYSSDVTPDGKCDTTHSVLLTDVGTATKTATPANNQIAFTVNAGTLKAKAGTLPTTKPNEIIVQVDLTIGYLDEFGAKRSTPVSHMFYGSTQLSFAEEEEKIEEYTASSSSSNIIFALLIIGAIVLSF